MNYSVLWRDIAESSLLAAVRPFAVLFRIDDPTRTVVIEAVKWVGY